MAIQEADHLPVELAAFHRHQQAEAMPHGIEHVQLRLDVRFYRIKDNLRRALPNCSIRIPYPNDNE